MRFLTGFSLFILCASAYGMESELRIELKNNGIISYTMANDFDFLLNRSTFMLSAPHVFDGTKKCTKTLQTKSVESLEKPNVIDFTYDVYGGFMYQKASFERAVAWESREGCYRALPKPRFEKKECGLSKKGIYACGLGFSAALLGLGWWLIRGQSK